MPIRFSHRRNNLRSLRNVLNRLFLRGEREQGRIKAVLENGAGCVLAAQ